MNQTAMDTSAFLTGRSPTAGLRGKTPYEKLFKRKVDASWFRPFGCIAYALIPGKKAYRLYDPNTKTVFTSRHVTFDEERNIDVKEFVGKNPEDEGPAAEQWEDLLRRQTVFNGEPKLTETPISEPYTSDDEVKPSAMRPSGTRPRTPTPPRGSPRPPDHPPPNYRKRKALRAPQDPESIASSRAKRMVKVADPNRELRRTPQAVRKTTNPCWISNLERKAPRTTTATTIPNPSPRIHPQIPTTSSLQV